MVAAREVVLRPEVTVRARNQAEVECLLSAVRADGNRCLGPDGFQVEVGGATPGEILKAVQQCLTTNNIESVRVALADGRKEYLLASGR